MAENQFMKNAHEKGLVDEREIALVADITCTNGNQGRAWFFLNGSILSLYELRGMANMGDLVETIDLKQAEFLKGSSFVLHSYLKFRYQGNTYHMTGFAQAKKVLEAFRESCNEQAPAKN